jgi:hypothetical protein
MSARKQERMTVEEFKRRKHDVGKRRGVMNKWETAFAAEVLEPRKLSGEIAGYWYEAIRVRLANGAWFCPDFMLFFPDRHVEFFEVKGFLREAASLRIKFAAEIFPFKFTMCYRNKRGGWRYVEYL